MNLQPDTDLRQATGTKTYPYFRVGKYETVIKSSAYKGLSTTDSTWGKVQVELEGAAGQTIRTTILVPFSDISKFKDRNGKNTQLPGQKLLQFVSALGETLNPKDLEATMTRLFGKDNALQGLNVAIETEYRGNYVQRQGDSIRILDKSGVPLVGVPEFADYADANKYAADKQIALKGFVDIKNFSKSVTPNVRKGDSVF
jgi:hypothetical protein